MLTPLHMDAAKAEIAYRNEIATRPALLNRRTRRHTRRYGTGPARRTRKVQSSNIVPLPERPFWAYDPKPAPPVPTRKGSGTPANPAA